MTTLLIIIGIAVYFLRKRISVGSSAIDDVKSAQDKLQEAQIKLQEESIRLDDKLIEVLNKQLPSISAPPIIPFSASAGGTRCAESA